MGVCVIRKWWSSQKKCKVCVNTSNPWCVWMPYLPLFDSLSMYTHTHTHPNIPIGAFAPAVNGPHLHVNNIPFQPSQHRELCGSRWCICALLTAHCWINSHTASGNILSAPVPSHSPFSHDFLCPVASSLSSSSSSHFDVVLPPYSRCVSITSCLSLFLFAAFFSAESLSAEALIQSVSEAASSVCSRR